MKKWKCTVCGQIFEGAEAPVPCPVCGAGAEAFEEVAPPPLKKWKCTVCGRIFEGEAPPVPCPVCGAGAEAFEEVSSATAVARWRCTVCGRIFEGDAPPIPCPVCKAGRAAFEKLDEAPPSFRKDTDDKYVLVGGGLAAAEAAKAIRQRNQTASVTIVADEAHYPYNRPALSGVVADGRAFEALLLEAPSYYEGHKITMRIGEKVTAINTTEKTVALSTGGSIPYTKLLLATGSFPFNPIQHGPDSIPVRVLRCFEDAEELIQTAAGKRVVIVGGGILGIEAAMALYARSCQIIIVEFAPRILSLQADETASARLQAKLEDMGIRVMCGKSVVSAGPAGVQLNDGTEIATDLALASMGVRSQISLAVDTGLEVSRGVVVNEFMHTSHPDIWAAGDCAEYDGRVLAVAGAAAAMGAVAGASMAGDESAAYRPFVPATHFEAHGFSLFSVGNVLSGAAETAVYENTQSQSYRKLFFENGRLAGALFIGQNQGAKVIHAVADGLPLAKALALLAP